MFQYRKSLFTRLGVLVVLFTITLTGVLFYQFNYSFSTQDSILDAHENYYYSNMVRQWGNIPDSTLIVQQLDNLKMWCGVYKKDVDKFGQVFPDEKYWSNLPENLDIENFINWTVSEDFELMYDIDIPLKVYNGEINSMPTTVVDNGAFLFYLVINYKFPNDLNNYIFAIILALIFIFGLYFFISHYLQPVQYMKDRISLLEDGDLSSEIKIIGEDELADLSISVNNMIKDIRILLDNKHQLLLEVSHELRSPLARMQFLIEMMPDHKNIIKLREEINFLEGMIDNLLLSDRLSMPYSKLNFQKVLCKQFIDKIVDLFPQYKKILIIENLIPNEFIFMDETKFIIAIRNLIDNAIKYSNNHNVCIKINKVEYIEFHIQDYGIGIAKNNLEQITEPFFQEKKSADLSGFGLGLTICKKIVESHNGTLSILSKEGEGSTFIVKIPISK